MLNATESPAGLFVELSYSAEIFHRTTVRRMLESFVALLESAVAAPDRPVVELDGLSRVARHRLLEELDDRRQAPLGGRRVEAVIEARARSCPDRVAVLGGGTAFTFGGLMAAAGRLAARLTAAGVGPGAPVLLAAGSPEATVVAILGTLEAGGCFVLDDPRWTAADRTAVLGDCGARFVVERPAAGGSGGGLEVAPVSGSPGGEPSVRRSPAAGGADEPAPGDAACRVYRLDPARGWRGRTVAHRELLNHFLWRRTVDPRPATPGGEAGDRTMLCAEVANPEVLAALASGATVRLAPADGGVGPQAGAKSVAREIARELERGRIAGLAARPRLVEALVAHRAGGGGARGRASAGVGSHLAALEEVVIGPVRPGSLAPELAERLFAAAPACRLYTLYAPEPGVPTLAARRWLSGDRRPAGAGGGVPLGRQLPNLSLRVLDRHGGPSPEGAHGELRWTGPVDAPTGEPNGGWGRRTGDLVRWAADGRLELLGRCEDRVTVGGIRIDLAGFRGVLAATPWIDRFAVAVRTGPSSEELLTAYLVPAGGATGDGRGGSVPGAAGEAELSRALAAALDEPAVPFAIVRLERIPLDEAGEVDLGALPAPDGPARPEAVALPPETPVEERMVPVWSKVLKQETVGVEHDFFAAGGASLSMIVLIKRISQEFGVDLPLTVFIQKPTIRGAARWVEAALAEGTGETAKGAPAPVPDARGDAPGGGAPDRASEAPIVPLDPARRARPMPVSFAQARIWFITELEQSRSSYNIVGALRLTGRLCRRSMRRTFQSLVDRHTILRTVYRHQEDAPVQSILDDVVFELPLQDLSRLPAARRDEVVRGEVSAESFRPFDLARDLSLRARLFRLAQDEHVLLVDMHHIASDGWSVGVFTRELAALYAAHLRGASDPLPELPVQYCDYAVWQREWLRGEVLDRHLSFWTERLKDPPKVHSVPLDRPRRELQSFRGAHHETRLPAGTVQELADLSRRVDATLFMTLEAALAVLVHRYSGDEDLVIGTPVANRLQREVEPLIGCFVNTLALRSDLSGDPRFVDFLRVTKDELLLAYAHQSLPFELLVEELNPTRDLRHAPLFQILFAFQDMEGSRTDEPDAEGFELGLPSLEVSTLDGDYPVSKFDLTLYARSGDDGLRLVWEYATDLFTEATVARIAGSFGALVESLVRRPEAPVGSLGLLTGAEERHVTRRTRGDREGRAGRAPAVEGSCLHEPFEGRARAQPDAVALLDGPRAWTYGGLDRAADRLARALGNRGVVAGDLVGICAERSAALVIALLGVLKAGAGYVPLDPGYPEERLRFMLADAGVALVLAAPSMDAVLPAGEWSRMALDGRWLEPGSGDFGEPGRVPEDRPAGEPGSLAYVIFTSGSTGRPKAVGISHRGAMALLRWAHQEYTPAELGGVLAATSVSFDLSVFELFVPLGLGGTVVLAANALELPTLVHRGRVTLVNTVPSVMAELLRLGGLPDGTRTVNLAGEVLNGPLARKVLAHGVRLLNLYGPSEDTTYSTGAEVSGDGEPTIGRPVAGSRAEVLDSGLGRVPTGVVGELYLGGPGVARGYLARPGLTARRFVPDALGAEPGARLYRTGDLARWRPDGDLEYLGRIDHQVKVRGFRVDLREIEAALRSHPQVEEAVVALEGAGVDEHRLVAYVVARDAEVPVGLRSWSTRRLPGYMVPSAFVALERIPLTPNGKLDRRALPGAGEAAEDRSERMPPGTDTERTLCALWQELLRRQRIGIEEDFFELGGHSLLAARLVSAVRSELGVEVPLRIVFEKPTILELATWLDLYTHDAEAETAGAGEARRGRGGIVVMMISYERKPVDSHGSDR